MELNLLLVYCTWGREAQGILNCGNQSDVCIYWGKGIWVVKEILAAEDENDNPRLVEELMLTIFNIFFRL